MIQATHASISYRPKSGPNIFLSQLLNGGEFEGKMKILVQPVIPDNSKGDSWSTNLEHVQTAVEVGTVFFAGAAPVVAGIGLAAMFINWLKDAYAATPEVLRFLMGYIVDLTLVLDQLFLIVPIQPPRLLTNEHLDIAVETYKNTDAVQVHDEIRRYATQASFAQIFQSNKAQERVIQLIQEHRADGGKAGDMAQRPMPPSIEQHRVNGERGSPSVVAQQPVLVLPPPAPIEHRAAGGRNSQSIVTQERAVLPPVPIEEHRRDGGKTSQSGVAAQPVLPHPEEQREDQDRVRKGARGERKTKKGFFRFLWRGTS
ncbi:hypothetical protein B0H13DRAFT_2367320 [Mycena leptocephala]|nr:hypothetical protein B0H13DRAFT_2367320 [Mycena leptocephala]